MSAPLRMDRRKISKENFEVATEDMFFSWIRKKVICKVTLPDGSAIDLTAKRKALPILVNGNGYCEFIGHPQYDYGIPKMETAGIINLKGKNTQSRGHYLV